MLIPIIFKQFSTTSLGDSSSWSDSYTPTENYTIKYIIIRRGDGNDWTDSTITMTLEHRAITRDSTLVAIFGTDIRNAMPLDIKINANETLEWTLTNREGTAIDVYMILVLAPETPITSP